MRNHISRLRSICYAVLPTVVGLLINLDCYSADNATTDSRAVYDEQVTPTVCQRCGSRHCECELMCCPQRVTETEKKSLWKVTCEYVCIPGFRFPWECEKDSCGRDCLVCGSVRAVNVLEEEKYECETCGYKWEVRCVRRSGETGTAGCQCPRCAEREQARLAAQAQPARK